MEDSRITNEGNEDDTGNLTHKTLCLETQLRSNPELERANILTCEGIGECRRRYCKRKLCQIDS